MFYKKYYFLVFLILGLLGIFSFSQAVEYGSLGGRPAYPKVGAPHGETWLIYNLSPGESFEDGAEVMNLYDESLEVLVYAADTTNSSGGGFALKQFSEPKENVGDWVKFYPNNPPEPFDKMLEKKKGAILEFCRTSREDLQKKMGKQKIPDGDFTKLELWCRGEDYVQKKMKAKEKIILPFIIKIPEEVDVGEHTGGILIQKITPENQEASQGSAIKLTTRVGIRIYETVPGEIIKKLSFEDFQVKKNFGEFDFKDWFSNPRKPQEYLVQSRVRNEGNTSFDYKDVIHVKNLIFKSKSQDIERSFQILRKDKFVSNYSWNNPRFGWLSFQAEAKYKDQNGEEQSLISPKIRILIMPWREIAIAFVLFLIGFAAHYGRKLYWKKKYGGIGWVEYRVRENDTLAGLAEKCGLDWNILAKTNKIKAPYILEASQSILVPPVLRTENLADGESLKEIGGKSENKPEKMAKEENLIDEEKLIEEASTKLLGSDFENGKEDKKDAKLQAKELKIGNSVTQKIPVEDLKKENFFTEIKNVPEGPVGKEKNFFEKLKDKRNGSSQEKEKYPHESKEDETAKYKRYLVILGIISAILIIFAGVLVGVLVYKPSVFKESVVERKMDIPIVPAPPSASNALPEETAENKGKRNISQKEISCADLDITVLNGTKIAGKAGEMKKYLEKEGCGEVNIGNAENEGYSGTAVYYASGKNAEAEKIKSILEKQYVGTVIKPAEEGNSDSNKADLTAIIGI